MTPSLDGPKAKLARALEHIDALAHETRRFLQGKPYRLVHEVDASNGDHVWCLKIDRPPPMRLSVIAGDAVHNLRSSLDHLTWQLSLTTTTTPYERTEFPIYADESLPKSRHCFNKLGRQKIRDLPRDAQEIIESVQPYQGRNPIGRDFWALHEISNIDKHRIALVPIPANLGGPLPPEARDFASAIIQTKTICDDGDEILRFRRDLVLYLKKQYKPRPFWGVAIDSTEVRATRRMPAVDLLKRIHRIISGELFPQFKRFFSSTSLT